MRDEGYIKYKGVLNEGPAPKWDSIRELHNCRQELFQQNLIGVYPDGIGFGNVSVKGSGNTFIITGSATGGKEELENSDYVKVLSFNAESNSLIAEGKVPASSESMSHGSIYNANAEIGAIIHIHSRRLFDFMTDRDFQHTPNDVPYGTPAMAVAVIEMVKTIASSKGLFYTAGHDEGIFAFGVSIAEAMEEINKLLNLFEREINNG